MTDNFEDKLKAKGLSPEALSEASCYYMHDDGETIVAEWPQRWPLSRVPGQPTHVSVGASSFDDSKRAKITKW